MPLECFIGEAFMLLFIVTLYMTVYIYMTTSNHQLAYKIVSHSELGKLTPVVNYTRQHIVCEFLDIVYVYVCICCTAYSTDKGRFYIYTIHLYLKSVSFTVYILLFIGIYI